MEALNRKQYSFLRTFSVVVIVLFLLFNAVNCGISSDSSFSVPPYAVTREEFVTTFLLKNSDGLALYYKFIKPGSSVSQNFTNVVIPTNTTLKSENYYLSNDEEVYVWFKKVRVVEPVIIKVNHALLGSGAKITVRDSSGKILIEDKMLLRNSKKTAPGITFISPMQRYQDTAIQSGTTDLAWVAVSYKLDPITVHTTPSLPTFIGYMRGLLIN